MAKDACGPQQTVAVILGASEFRRAPRLAQGRAFYNSARDFYDYLVGNDGLSIAVQNVLWLFDDTRSSSDQLTDVAAFLEGRCTALKQEGSGVTNMIFYYVGHGLFAGGDRAYCLAIRNTDVTKEGFTCIRSSDLASTITGAARFVRKFLILDCCFSSAAYKEFQAAPLEASRVKLLEELPQRGTALLCSASAQDASLAPEGLGHTMFTGGLLAALKHGHPQLGSQLSLSELGDLVKARIRESYPDNWVRPEVHSPDQREGDVASVPLFPNLAYRASQADKGRPDHEGALRLRDEAAARQRAESARKAQSTDERRRVSESHRAREQAVSRQSADVEPKPFEISNLVVSDAKVHKPLQWIGALVVVGLIIAPLSYTPLSYLPRTTRNEPAVPTPTQSRPIDQAEDAADLEDVPLVLPTRSFAPIDQAAGAADQEDSQIAAAVPSQPSHEQAIGPSDQEILDFIAAFLAVQSRASPRELLGLYADRVDYFGQLAVDHNFIFTDKANYYRRWPKLENQLDGSINIERSALGDTVKVSYPIRWAVEDLARNVRKAGTAKDELTLSWSGGQLHIIGQKQQVFAQ